MRDKYSFAHTAIVNTVSYFHSKRPKVMDDAQKRPNLLYAVYDKGYSENVSIFFTLYQLPILKRLYVHQ